MSKIDHRIPARLCRPTAWPRLLARAEGGAIAVIFALVLLPTILVIGAAVDYARLEQFKTQLQSVADAAALAGASAYVDTSSAASANAVTVANNYMNSSILQLPSHIGNVSYTVTPSQNSSGSNQGYVVTVNTTGSIGTSFMRIFASSLPVSATAVAVNPLVTISFDIGGWYACAWDLNTIYWYQVPADGSVPPPSQIPTGNQIASNAGVPTSQTGSSGGCASQSNPNPPPVKASMSSTGKLAFALQNVTGGRIPYGANGYGAAQGSTQWFFSQRSNNISTSVYPNSPNGNCSLQTQAVTTSSYPTAAPGNGTCASATPTLAQGGTSCSQFSQQLSSSQSMRYFWNDMGGGHDDLDYNDAEYNVSCAGAGGGPTMPYLTQ